METKLIRPWVFGGWQVTLDLSRVKKSLGPNAQKVAGKYLLNYQLNLYVQDYQNIYCRVLQKNDDGSIVNQEWMGPMVLKQSLQTPSSDLTKQREGIYEIEPDTEATQKSEKWPWKLDPGFALEPQDFLRLPILIDEKNQRLGMLFSLSDVMNPQTCGLYCAKDGYFCRDSKCPNCSPDMKCTENKENNVSETPTTFNFDFKLDFFGQKGCSIPEEFATDPLYCLPSANAMVAACINPIGSECPQAPKIGGSTKYFFIFIAAIAILLLIFFISTIVLAVKNHKCRKKK
jgi:hypothetical protein